MVHGSALPPGWHTSCSAPYALGYQGWISEFHLHSLEVSSRSMVTEIVPSSCSSSSHLFSSSNGRSVLNEGGNEAREGTGSYASRLTVIGRKIAAQLGSSTEQSGRSSWSGVELIPTKCAPHTSNHSCC